MLLVVANKLQMQKQTIYNSKYIAWISSVNLHYA